MKIVLGIGLFCSSVWAAIPQTQVMDILSMPEGNRKVLIKNKSADYAKSFIQVAFDDKQTMSYRWKALIAASEIGDSSIEEELIKASRHQEWFMRNAALVALSQRNPDLAFTVGRRLLKDKALVVRSAAVDVLSKIQRHEVRDLLWEELHQSYNFKNKVSLWIRPQIVKYLQASPQPNERKMFAILAKDSDPQVQKMSQQTVEKFRF